MLFLLQSSISHETTKTEAQHVNILQTNLKQKVTQMQITPFILVYVAALPSALFFLSAIRSLSGSKQSIDQAN